MADHEVDLAELAKRNFEEQSFESCLSTVNKLCDLKKSDPKVLHNRAVAHYYLSNLTLTDDFKKVLYQVDQQMDQEAEETGVELSPVDKSIVLYNQSVLLFHLRQYSEALRILERLFQVRQSLEEALAYKVAFMCLDIYLKTYRNDSAAEMITYLDNLLFDVNRQDFSMELSISHSNTNLYKPLMHQFRARLCLAVRQLKNAKKEIKELSLLRPHPTQGADETDPSMQTPDPTVLPSPTLSVAAIFLKSNYEFLRGNYRKSLKLLSTSPGTPFLTDCGECLPSLYFNNVASCHAMMGKHTLAAYYFRKALEENDRALTDFPPTDRSVPLAGRPLAVLGVNRHHELVYQLGIQLLFSGKPLQAFECLLGAVQVFRTNPRVWHRLAESCVSGWQLREKELVRQERYMSSTVQVLEGQGINRKLLLTPMRLQSHKPMLAPTETLSVGPTPTLEFGSLCVKNALYLLTSSNRDPLNGSHHSSMPGPALSPAEGDSLHSSLLASGAYISLGLCDPVVALDYCNKLLECPNLTPALRFLGSIYKTEALIILGRISEASELLSPDSIQDSWFSEYLREPGPPSQPLLQEGMSQPQTASYRIACKNEFPSTGNQARLITYLNLCSVFSMAGEFDKARGCLTAVSQLGLEETHPNAVLLAVYIELQTGNLANALQMIKHHQYVIASKVDKKRAKKS